MVPGTFWYDFLTCPALGGIGALAAALIIGGATLKVSLDRRNDAAEDRAAERQRAMQEEWFRRVQWAQRLTESDVPGVEASGFYLLDYLGRSSLAGADDRQLLVRLTRTGATDAEAITPRATVDVSEYVVDDGEQEEPEALR